MWLAACCAAGACFAGGASVACAEQGLAVARFGGGVSTPAEKLSLGGALSLSVDLALTERFGIVVGGLYQTVPSFGVLGLGLGLKILPFEWFWRRIYLHLGPDFALVFEPDQPARADLALRGSLGYEEILFWGTGLFVEFSGVAILGLREGASGVTPMLGLTAGLFLEF